jgi:hypothetical protein
MPERFCQEHDAVCRPRSQSANRAQERQANILNDFVVRRHGSLQVETGATMVFGLPTSHPKRPRDFGIRSPCAIGIDK